MDWKKQLDKIQIKEEDNGTTANRRVSEDCGNSDRSIDSSSVSAKTPDNRGMSSIRSSIIFRSAVPKKVSTHNIKEGGQTEMITAKGALDDYEAIVKEDVASDVKMVKIMKIIIKLLLGIRTNQRGGVPASEQKPVRTEQK